MLHTRVDSGLDERGVLLDAVGALGRRHHEHDLGAGEGCYGCGVVGVARLAHGGAGQLGGARGVPHDEAEWAAPLRHQLTGDEPADGSRGSGDGHALEFGTRVSEVGRGRFRSPALPRVRRRPSRLAPRVASDACLTERLAVVRYGRERLVPAALGQETSLTVLRSLRGWPRL